MNEQSSKHAELKSLHRIKGLDPSVAGESASVRFGNKSLIGVVSKPGNSPSRSLKKLLKTDTTVSQIDSKKVPVLKGPVKPTPPEPKNYLDLELLYFPENLEATLKRIVPIRKKSSSEDEDSSSVISQMEKHAHLEDGSIRSAKSKIKQKAKPHLDNSLSILPQSVFLTSTAAVPQALEVQGNYKILTPQELELMAEQGIRTVPELKHKSGVFVPLEALKMFPEYQKLSERVSSLPKIKSTKLLRRVPSTSISKLINSKDKATEQKLNPMLSRYWRQLSYNRKTSNAHNKSCVDSLDSSVRSIVHELREERKKIAVAETYLFPKKAPPENEQGKDFLDDAASFDDRLSANGTAHSRKSRSVRKKETGPRNFMLGWGQSIIPSKGFIEFREGRACCAERNKVYMFGGYCSGGNLEPEGIQAYDIIQNKLERLPFHKVTPPSRSYHKIVKMLDSLYIFELMTPRYTHIDCAKCWPY